ncbi:MAG: hypothetical protein Q8J88_11555 [Bacteroidales bacterium]|nr:hypothetical protein [Bacteroidales bacterium]
MKENMSQPKHAARQSLLWNAAILWPLSKNYLPQTARMTYSNTSININSKYERSIEKQPLSAPHWRYPVKVVYKGLAYFRELFYTLFLKFNNIQYHGI